MNTQPNAAAPVVAITYVKRPWYGLRALIVSRFKKSIPEYEAVPGLLAKQYALTADGQVFGGIYLFRTRQDAQNWFNPAWFSRIEKTYGAPGKVAYYRVTSVGTVSQPVRPTGTFWTVLSLGEEPAGVNRPAAGLLRVVAVSDRSDGPKAGQTGSVTLWRSKVDAERYFAGRGSIQQYFDTPVLIDKLPKHERV